jgi:Nucleoside-diphosphate-sugar epimerases
MEKLLFTGASGFLGHCTLPVFYKKYKVVHTIGLADDDDIKFNLAKGEPPIKIHYDIVLHACGKAHVAPKTKDEKQDFYDVNYQGTVNLCAALEKVGAPKAFIFISSVAVYGCEYGDLITEDHPLEGTSPYAESKIMAEKYLTEWCAKHGVILSILRPALLAGPNPPGNLGAMINGIKTGRYMDIAGGKARKSMLMVEDIANLVPLVANGGGVYNLCDDYHPTFRELEKLISCQLRKNLPLTIPYWLARGAAIIGDTLGRKAPINTARLKKITSSLTFSNEKAKRELGWKPISVIENFYIE